MVAVNSSPLRGAAVLLFAVLLCGVADSASQTTVIDIFAGYYSREQNDGELAKASGKSQFIRFYENDRIVILFIPYLYATSVEPATIRQVFERAVRKTPGDAYISDTFGLLDERATVHLDRIRLIDGGYFFDCGAAVPCRIEFTDDGMNVIRRGIVNDTTTEYDLVPD
jgi:hypothetical protein